MKSDYCIDEKSAHLDCFSLQFQTIECVDGLICIIWIHIVYKAISQTLT